MRWVGIFLQGGTYNQRAKFIAEIKNWYNEHSMRCMCFVHGSLNRDYFIMSPLRKQLAECMIYEFEFRHPMRDNRSRMLAYKLPQFGYKTIVVTLEPTEPNMTSHADYRITIHPQDNLIPVLLEVTGGLNASKGISSRYATNLRRKSEHLFNVRGRNVPKRKFDRSNENWDESGQTEEDNLLS